MLLNISSKEHDLECGLAALKGSQCIRTTCAHSVVADSVTPWTVAHQGPLSMGFTREEHWSGLPCPTPGDLPDSGIEPTSALAGDSGKPHVCTTMNLKKLR